MGQAWCKEKTSKAQDSKSPLDRVFVRCAHRIYPSLKEEGSVLGGATQRVTSSEIGYAGSPPREVLTRGRSIDSVDRPFHPSDWVDVNLEVPSTPRASSVLTNLTVDTTLYPATTPTSSCSNLKDVTPVPPPRRRKKNRGRPLPPKPDEIPEKSSNNLKHADGTEEPLYSSVKSPKTSGDEQDGMDEIKTDKSCSYQEDSKHEGKRTKEIYEHKVNGTGRIIPSDVVSGKRTSDDRKNSRTSESGHHHREVHEEEEYDRFTKHQSPKDSSTPNHRQDRISKAKDLERPINDSVEDVEITEANTRTKSYSTVSLPNYDELDISRHPKKRTNVETGNDEKTKARRPVRCSTVSLPAETLLSPFSEKTTVRLEDYIARRGSIEHLSSYQVLGKLDRSENGDVDDGFVKYDPSKLEDWDLSDISNCELNHQRRLSFEIPSVSEIKYEKQATEEEDVVDFSHNAEIENSNRTSLTSVKKPEAFGKPPIHEEEEDEDEYESSSKYHDDWIVSEHRPHMRYFDPPTLAENCRTSSECDATNPPVTREPFFLDESKHLSVLDTIGESCRNGSIIQESDRSEQSRMIFSRSLSNESEPYEDVYESKELRNHRQVTSNLIRTISEESLPREMLENVDQQLDEFFDEKLAKDVHNKLKKDCVEPKVTVKTPPPSPEPRIKPEILDNDHSTLLKVLKEEAAEESNLSSMTPSLTELEAALSDMLEKEDSQEERAKDQDKTEDSKLFTQTASCTEKPIEPAIVPVEKTPISFKNDSENVVQGNSMIEIRGRTSDKILVDEDFEERIDEVPVSLGQVLEEKKPAAKVRKVSFCAWEENRMAEIDLKNDREFIDREKDLDKNTVTDQREDQTLERFEENEISWISSEDTRADSKPVACLTDIPPEKPSRLYRNLDDLMDHVENMPTPPRRKNKGSLGVGKKETETSQNGSAIADPYPDDRLI